MEEPRNENWNIAGSQTELEVVQLGDEAFEIEVNEDDIAYIIEDEDGVEIGFALLEDGEPVEYYYAEGDAGSDGSQEMGIVQVIDVSDTDSATKKVLGAVGGAAAKGAKSAGRAAVTAGKGMADVAKQAYSAGREGGIKAGANVVGAAAKEAGKSLKENMPSGSQVKENLTISHLEETLGITKEDMQAVAGEIRDVAKDGAELAKEMKGALDDLRETFDFLPRKGGKFKRY